MKSRHSVLVLYRRNVWRAFRLFFMSLFLNASTLWRAYTVWMNRLLVFFFVGIVTSGVSGAGQLQLPVIDQMPDCPSPLVLRDWKQVARDVDAYVYDFSKEGDFLPLPWWDRSRINYPIDVVALPAYIGSRHQTEDSNAYDTITCFGAVLGGTLVGLDKSREAEMLNAYFQKANGIELYLNNVQTVTGHTFWYEMLPSLLFYQVYDHYRDTPEMKQNFVRTAERWYEAIVDMGGAHVDFDWTAYSFTTGKPVDNGTWKEPDAAAAVAWLEYMAYTQTGNTNFLNAAGWAMNWLDARQENPYYECLLPYGAYAAARMNAELGTTHEAEKIVRWILVGDNPRKWGVTPGGWGKQNCAGLTGSVYPNHEYVFAMNTYLAAGVMLPIVRYDDRYADAFGKWMLNVTIHSRYFYSNAWNPEDQTCSEWASQYDPQNCFAYEGIRKEGWARTYASEDVSTAAGSVQGSWKDSRYADQCKQMLVLDDTGKLEHIWKLKQVAGLDSTIVCWADAPTGESEFSFFLSNRPDGGWMPLFDFSSQNPVTHRWKPLSPDAEGVVYVKVIGSGNVGVRLAVEDIYIQTKLDKAPYLMGDPTMMGWGKTDLGLYGSVYVGLLGAIVEPTDVEGILQLDCRATESFAAPSYPTHLYYNPYSEAKTVTVPLDDKKVDLYDAVSSRFIAREQSGSAKLRIAPKSSVLLVQCPAGGALKRDGQKTMVNDVVIDYR